MKRMNKIKKIFSWNNRGSILQIVLIAFIIFTFFMSVLMSYFSSHIEHYHSIKELMFQKNLEISLIQYYCQTMENDILISDEYVDSHYTIEYQVDDMGTFYEILTSVVTQKYQYGFLVQIDTTSYHVIKFEYKEV